jgi:hypothetical protein
MENTEASPRAMSNTNAPAIDKLLSRVQLLNQEGSYFGDIEE